MSEPVLVVHGGAGEVLLRDPSVRQRERIRARMLAHLREAYGILRAGGDAVSAVVDACRRLEDDEELNAGTGSVLQADGSVRLSASLMNGSSARFSGVINAQGVKNPIKLALHLQAAEDRVLSEAGHAPLLRQLGEPAYDPRTPARIAEHARGAAPLGVGTVGAVARDRKGLLAAATSTGGRGFASVGRVSDSCTPAGNFASAAAALSCTGRGEDIVELGFAVRVVVRVEDGDSLPTALRRSLAEAERNGRQLAAIGVDASGAIGWGSTTGLLVGASQDLRGIQSFF